MEQSYSTYDIGVPSVSSEHIADPRLLQDTGRNAKALLFVIFAFGHHASFKAYTLYTSASKSTRLVASLAFCALALSLCVCMGDADFDAVACDFDSDCPPEALCVFGRCAQTCLSDEECVLQSSMAQCVPFQPRGQFESVNVCLDPDVNPGQTQCETDEDCLMRLGNPDAQCGLQQVCILPNPTVSPLVVLIEDQTLPSASLDIEDPVGPGIDIAAIYVENGRGQIVGWGLSEVFKPVEGRGSERSHILGQPLPLTEDEACVAQGPDGTTTSLGGNGMEVPGGSSMSDPGRLLVSFVDERGNMLSREPGQVVVVVEWGENCDANGGEVPRSDQYAFFFCLAPDGDPQTVDIERDCTVQESSVVSGRATFGVSSAQ